LVLTDFFFFFGARGRLAGRRYAAPLASLLGPAAACGGLGLAYGHGCAALGRSTVFFLWAVFFGG